MNNDWLERSTLIVGADNIKKLNNTHVMIVGMGGVGSFAAEFICRAGVGEITIVDADTIDSSNRNRQLPALSTNIGESKVGVMAQRLKDINPEVTIHEVQEFITPETAGKLMEAKPDYLLDCIDTLQPKLTLIDSALQNNIPLASSMGAGGKMDPTQIKIADISKSHTCPFASKVRKYLHRKKIYKGFKVAFSPEPVIRESLMMTEGTQYKKSAYGTISYLPAAFGGVVASIAIRDLTGF